MLLSKIKQRCKQQGITIAELERQTNISRGSIGKWDTSQPSIDKIILVADYFKLPIDELIGRTPSTIPLVPIQPDICQLINTLQNQLLHDQDLLFHGQPASSEIRSILLTALEIGLKMAEKKAT